MKIRKGSKQGDRNANGVLPGDAGRPGRLGLADLWGVLGLDQRHFSGSL